MEILVCIKQVPDDSVNVKMNPATGAPDLSNITPIVNAFDTYALEMATRLKEAVGGTITVVCVGPDKAKDAIKTCLAVGASNGFIVKDEVTSQASDALDKLGDISVATKENRDLIEEVYSAYLLVIDPEQLALLDANKVAQLLDLHQQLIDMDYPVLLPTLFYSCIKESLRMP